MRLLSLLCALALALSAPAAPLEHSLDRGLSYVRFQTLPADFSAIKSSDPGALVVDLRFVEASAETTETFLEWLKERARPRHPVIILVNAGTSRHLLARITGKNTPAGVVTIGAAAEAISPDLALAVSADDDRAAYDALADGTPVDVLIDRKIEKVRRDEAYIVRGRSGPASSPAAEGEAAAAKPDGDAAPLPPFDAVLQRAVQLHRTLLALRRI